MKYIVTVLVVLFCVLASCSSMPEIIPDKTPDNVVIAAYKDQINEPGIAKPSYSWLFWYAPIAIVVLLWAYRELLRKPIPKNCIDSEGQTVREQTQKKQSNKKKK
jgi:hypothetical protein